MQVLILSVILGILVSLVRSFHTGFQPSELQHIHIAWNISQGLVPYRDFFEHHGPLVGYINAGLLYLTGPTWTALFLLRAFSWVASIILVLQTEWLFRNLFPEKNKYSLWAAFFMASSYVFIYAGAAIRPDTVQAVFLLAALQLFYLAYKQASRRVIFFSGFFAGLMLLCNFKMIPAWLFVLFFVGYSLRQQFWYYLLGSCAAFLPWLGYSLYAGILYKFFFYGIVYNFSVLSTQSAQFWPTVQLFFKWQGEILIVFILGLISLLKQPASSAEYFPTRFVLVGGMSVSVLAVAGVYGYYYLVVWPFIAIISAYGFALLRQNTRYFWQAFIFGTFCITIFFWYSFMPTKPTTLLLRQEKTLAYILEKYPRTTPMLFLWTPSPAFIFNSDLDFFWHTSEQAERTYLTVWGYDVFGPISARILRKEVPVIVSDQATLARVFPRQVLQGIRANYSLRDGSVWELR